MGEGEFGELLGVFGILEFEDGVLLTVFVHQPVVGFLFRLRVEGQLIY